MVVNVQRLADGAGVLAPQERAFKLPGGWTIVDHPLDSLAGAPEGPGLVTGYLELVPPVGAALSGTVTTTDGTTVKTLLVMPIPTGSFAWLRITLAVQFGGNVYLAEARKLIRNPGGTPVDSSGTYTPSSKTVMEVDETSGAFTGGSAVFGETFAAGTMTFTATGMAATTMQWALTVEPLLFTE